MDPLILTPVKVRRVVRIAVRLSPVVALTEERIAVEPKPVAFLGKLTRFSSPFESSAADNFKLLVKRGDEFVFLFFFKRDKDPRWSLDSKAATWPVPGFETLNP